ncbi:MAG: DUF4349 domain-containing protein, partial [bacterium]|nr:DUF4349 domain-containing protein [bacterium]
MSLKKKIFGGVAILLLIIVVLALIGYIQEQRQMRAYSYSGGSGFASMTGLASKSGFGFSDMMVARESAPPSSPVIDIQKTDRMIIKTGTIAMVVVNVRESVAAIRALVEEKGGFIISSNVSGAEAQLTGAMTLRLPAKLFDEAFVAFKGIAKKVTGEYVRGEDVTEEYSDSQVQLRNFEAEETQFLKILETAKTIQETLDVT